MNVNEYQTLAMTTLNPELEEAATALDISLEEVFQANIDKLKKRYPKGFDARILIN